jgi:hypothetical protein
MQKRLLFLGLCALVLAGCATSTSYVNYTGQRFQAKDPSYVVNVYSQSQPIDAKISYYVIGKVSIEGFVSSGVTPDGLTRQAQLIARKRGADAIINVRTEAYHYYGGDALLRFKGELIVYAANMTK